MVLTGKELAHTPGLGILYEEESGRGLTHPFFSLILDAVKAAAWARGYNITFIHASAEDEEGKYVSRCGDVDGVCIVCADFQSPRIQELIDSGLPCLSIDHMFRGSPSVLSDNETGVQRLVEYAISLGHRRIAFIHGQENSIVTRTRLLQFHNTMSFYNIPVLPGFVCAGLYNDMHLTRKLVGELLKRPERPTCILLPDDITYLGAQEAALEAGLRIPDDISFAGYDGIPLTQSLTPPLTTIRQSCEDMGRTAADRLIDLIENPSCASRRPTVFPVTLVKGGTISECRQG